MSHVRLLPSMVMLAACASPPAPAAPAPAPPAWPFVTTTQLGHPDGALVPIDAPWRAVGEPAPGRREGAPPSTAARILPSLTGGTFDRSYGADLDAAIAALPEDRRALGLAGVSGEAMYGDARLCEDPHVALNLDGAEVSLLVPRGSWFVGHPARDLQPLPEACVASLLGAGGSISGATCDAEDVQAHFPAGSDCRACLSVDGDHARCVTAGACAETATRQVRANAAWHAVLRAPALLCAPDHVADMFVLVEGLAESDPLPETFDHGGYSGVCLQGWDGDGVDFYCDLGDYHALGDLLYSRVDHVRDGGPTDWAGRISLVASMEVEGYPFSFAWLNEAGGTGVSAPVGAVKDGWGLNPRHLRPGGVDPENPDDTYARDYVAALTLKTLTVRDGVLVNPVNRNRCAEDAWVGPHADGTWSCDEPGAWSESGWYDDAAVRWWDPAAGEIYAFPLVTLASTGLPDPNVPGGLLTEVRGSTTLADAEWEGCAWPAPFTPDRVRLYDPAPASSDVGYASFDGQTYRLGRDPDFDVRLFLATSELRGFCPP